MAIRCFPRISRTVLALSMADSRASCAGISLVASVYTWSPWYVFPTTRTQMFDLSGALSDREIWFRTA